MTRPAALVALALLVGACNRPDADTREWRPTDHAAEPPASAAARPGPPASAAPRPAPHGPNPHGASLPPPAPSGNAPPPAARAAMTDWSRLCVRCHGRIGRGDGPMGKAVGAPNLTDPAWQSATTDERIRATIQQGRGQMPAFDLPSPAVDGLVGLVRMMRAEPEGGAP